VVAVDIEELHPVLFPAGNCPQVLAQSAEGISVAAGIGNGGEPPGQTVISISVPTDGAQIRPGGNRRSP
jgi:hypothetical protein